MAVNLARSFIWWHPDSDIAFFIATDQQKYIPDDIEPKIKVINLTPGEYGNGFTPKLNLDKLAPSGKTLFIDSDCLIFADLSPVFEKFNGHSVSVIGGYISSGDWFGDIAAICKKFKVNHLPKFNGGVYYINNDNKAKQVYETARELEKQYDDIGFTRFRNHPADEMLMALAMQLNGQTPIIDDGTIMSDMQACAGKYSVNTITGERELTNPPPPSPLHSNWYPFQKVSPIVVHFLGHHTQHYPYKKEAYRLKMALNKRLNLITEAWALFALQYPQQIKILTKKLFRPIYHRLFGLRKIQPSERIA